jgi:hypothetical protein
MSNFMASNGAVYSDYWDINASGYNARVSDGEHPVAGAALKAAFAAVPPASSPTVMPPPGPILWVGAAETPTPTSVSVNFSPPYGGGAPSHFVILYRTSGTSSWSTYGTAQCVGTQSLCGLKPGTSYDVSVMAVNAGGSGPQSAPISLSTLAPPPPAAQPPGPILWVGVGGSATATSLSINFSPPYGGGAPSSYTILFRKTGSSSWATYGSVASVGCQTLGKLQSGTSYNVSVEAVNAAGSGPQSAFLSLSTLSGASSAAALPGVIPWIGQGQASTNNTISINFCPPNVGGAPTGYVIMIRISGQSAWQKYGVVTWTGWQTLGGLVQGTSYDTEVYATNAAGSGQPSAVYTDSTL